MKGSVPLQKDTTVNSWSDYGIVTALKKKYESMIIENQGVILMIIGNVHSTGTTLTDNESKNHTIWFDVIIFYPKLLEVVLGEIMEITNFGAIVRIGPLDAQLHISEIFDDKAIIDPRSQIITANNGETIKKGNIVRGRITSVGIPKNGGIKIGITCKQHYLGKIK